MEQSPPSEAEVCQFTQSNSPHFMELERSSPCSQQRPIFPDLQPDQSSRVPSYIFNIRFDFILLHVSSFSKLPLSFRFFLEPKSFMHFSSPSCVPHALPIPSTLN